MAYGVIMGQSPDIPDPPVNPPTIASNVSYNNSSTSEAISGKNVQVAIDQLFSWNKGKVNDLTNKYNQLFQSVSDGKRQIAGAITDKGVSTSSTASFSTMANNIRQIQTGGGLGFLETLINGNYFNPGRRVYSYTKGSGWVLVLTSASAWNDSSSGGGGATEIIDIDSRTYIGISTKIEDGTVAPMRAFFNTNADLAGWRTFGTTGSMGPNGEVGQLTISSNYTKLDFSEAAYNALKNACRIYTP